MFDDHEHVVEAIAFAPPSAVKFIVDYLGVLLLLRNNVSGVDVVFFRKGERNCGNKYRGNC